MIDDNYSCIQYPKIAMPNISNILFSLTNNAYFSLAQLITLYCLLSMRNLSDQQIEGIMGIVHHGGMFIGLGLIVCIML